MSATRHTIHCHTRGNGDILDLTEDVQRVVLVDLDTRPRDRTIVITVIGA